MPMEVAMMGKITFNATYKKGITGGGARLSAEDGWGDVVDLLLDDDSSNTTRHAVRGPPTNGRC